MQDPLFCSNCGAPAQRRPRPGVGERFRSWFVHGDRGSGDRFECENGHSWVSATVHAGSRPRLWHRVRRLCSTVMFKRTVVPTPSSYLVIAGVGTVVGGVCSLLLGWSWWLGPLGFVVVAWLLYLSTAFRGRQRAGTLRAIHDQLDPLGAWQRHEDLNRRVLAEASFAVCGLVDNLDSPSLGGLSRRDEDLTGITLVYGDRPAEGTARLEITTSVDNGPPGFARHCAEDELRHSAAGLAHGTTSSPSQLSAEIDWSPTEVVIDGERHPAELAKLEGTWVVVAETVDRSVTIWGSCGLEHTQLALGSRPPSEYLPVATD